MSTSQFTIYRSSDTSAPVLTGATGTLTALLDACLVNGYGSKSAAGWAIAFTGTSKRAYRSPSGSRLYYRIDDSGPGSDSFVSAGLRGYETMSDVDTGTGLFPTLAQVAAPGVTIRKSAAVSGTVRSWIVVADARSVIVAVLTGDTAAVYMVAYFGEVFSLVASDAYNGMVIGNLNGSATNYFEFIGTTLLSAYATHYMARGYSGLGGSVQLGKHGDQAKGISTAFAGTVTGPDPTDGSIYLSPIWLSDQTTGAKNSIRGRLRGIWAPCHVIGTFADGDTWNGVNELAGKTFLAIKTISSVNSIAVIETSNTVETN